MSPTDDVRMIGPRLYFYCCTIVALGALVSGVRMIGDYRLDDPRVREAREVFEDLLPYRSRRFEPLTDDAVKSFLLYLSTVGQMIDHRIDDPFYLTTWYDMSGDYLQSYLLPVSKYCFYSGNVTYQSVRSVINYYRKIKLHLDTDGSGWSRPDLDTSDADNKISLLQTTKTPANCSELDLGISAEIPLPKTQLDDDSRTIISLWFPFRTRQVYDPRSASSLSILRIYFESVMKCVPKSSRKRFPSSFLHWIDEYLKPHTLDDVEFYPGLEGILQIKKTLASARNLDKKSTDHHPNLFENWFAADNSSSIREDYTDYNDADASLDYAKITVVALGLGLFLLVIVLIVLKMLQNRRVMRRKEKLEAAAPKRFFRRKDAVHSDEEVLLALNKNVKKPSQARHSWSYIKKPRPMPSSKQLPPFSETDGDADDADINFEQFLNQNKTAVERLPLLPKPSTSGARKKRCGPNCSCLSCRKKKSTPDSSPGYQLANEMTTPLLKGGKKSEQEEEEEPILRNLRGGMGGQRRHRSDEQWDEV